MVDLDLTQLKALFDTLKESEISEFEYEDEKVRLRIGRGGQVVTAQMLAAPPGGYATAPVARGEAPRLDAVDESKLDYVTSPFVGTFYRSPSPDAPSFVEVGSPIREGQTLCIVEAMKLMNEIEADASGVIVECMAENGKPVEFGQKLFKIQKA